MDMSRKCWKERQARRQSILPSSSFSLMYNAKSEELLQSAVVMGWMMTFANHNGSSSLLLSALPDDSLRERLLITSMFPEDCQPHGDYTLVHFNLSRFHIIWFFLRNGFQPLLKSYNSETILLLERRGTIQALDDWNREREIYSKLQSFFISSNLQQTFTILENLKLRYYNLSFL